MSARVQVVLPQGDAYTSTNTVGLLNNSKIFFLICVVSDAVIKKGRSAA